MTDAPSFDALPPPAMAARAEDVGVAKANMNGLSLLLLAVLAGAFIALGAVFSTVAVTGAGGHLPWGVTRVLAGLTFCLGLILVVIAGAELFTGNNLLMMAFASGKLSLRKLLRNWAIVYAGNFVGASATAVLVFFTGQYRFAEGQVGITALRIAEVKCALPFMEAFWLGVYCNALVCLAVWLCLSCRTTGEKILAVLFPITAFVAAGFEHSVANMYFIPIGMAIKSRAGEGYFAMVGSSPESFTHLTARGFLVDNLLPVTLGNIVGGAGMVAVVYWVVYCRKSTRKTT